MSVPQVEQTPKPAHQQSRTGCKPQPRIAFSCVSPFWSGNFNTVDVRRIYQCSSLWEMSRPVNFFLTVLKAVYCRAQIQHHKGGSMKTIIRGLILLLVFAAPLMAQTNPDWHNSF